MPVVDTAWNFSDCIISNKDYGGYNVDLVYPSPTSYDCYTKCQGDSRCLAFTHNNATQWCFKKFGRLVEASDLTGNNCGQKSCDGWFLKKISNWYSLAHTLKIVKMFRMANTFETIQKRINCSAELFLSYQITRSFFLWRLKRFKSSQKAFFDSTKNSFNFLKENSTTRKPNFLYEQTKNLIWTTERCF